jgi:hypothetical protein
MAFNFSPTPYNAKPLDFSELANIPDQFWKGQDRAKQNAAQKGVSEALARGDYQAAAAALASANPGAALNSASDLEAARLLSEYRGATLDQGNRELDLKYPGGKPRRTATDTKALYDAQDELPDVDNTIELLKRAGEINDKTFEGVGASIRGTLGAKLPDWAVSDKISDPERAKATNEWEMLMAPAALEKMSETLKGQTSNLELQRYIGFLADPSTPAATRKEIIRRLTSLAEKQRAVRAQRIEEIGGGAGVDGDGDQPMRTGPGAAPKFVPPGTLQKLQQAVKEHPEDEAAIKAEFDKHVGEPGSADFYLYQSGH